MTDLDVEEIKTRREGVPHVDQWGLYKTVVPYDAEYDIPEHPVIELSMLDSTNEEADRTFDFLNEITWDVDALVEEVEQLRDRLTITNDMIERAATEIFDRPFPSAPRATEMRGIARAALEAALGGHEVKQAATR